MHFSDLNLNKPLLNALSDLNLEEPTNIQQQVFSQVMSGKDLCAIAQTGTGKTIGYLLPLLRIWQYSKDKLPQILVIVPTRELVIQVLDVVKSLTTYLNFEAIGVYGGTNLKNQVSELQNGCDLIVCTPGRFIDLAACGALKVKNIKKVVLDEFDMMLDLGFRPQLDTIFDKIPERRQNLMFSATLTEQVENLFDAYFKSPLVITAQNSGTPLANIEQKAYLVPNFNTKINFLELLLQNDEKMTKNLVFVTNKYLADLLFENLKERGIENIDLIHSNKSQNYRFNAIKRFENGETKTLIATDIASRGIDFCDLSHVINMELSDEPEAYIHRMGRTGRAQKFGTSIMLFSERENDLKTEIETLMGTQIEVMQLPDYLEISDDFLAFEQEDLEMKIIEPKKAVHGPAFHEKSVKNQKVNVRRNIEEEKKRKYGKSYKKAIK